MANSKTGGRIQYSREEIVAKIEELDKQLKEINAGRIDANSIKKAVFLPPPKSASSSGDRISTYNDIIFEPKRTMYDLRNFHNFRSNADNKAINGATETFPNPNRSFYLSDICYSDYIHYTGSNVQLNPDVQTIVLNEFQPNMTVAAGKLISKMSDAILGATGNLIEKGVEKIAGKNLTNFLGMAAQELAGPLVRQKMLDYYSENPSKLYGGGGSATNQNISNMFFSGDGVASKMGKSLMNTLKLDPIEQIRFMFQGGKWLNTYELPFFNDTYLETCKAGSWSNEGINQQLSDPAGVVGTVMQGLKINYPTAPVYNMQSISDAGREDINFSFYLINKDEVALLRNFQFLNAFFSGTQFVSMVGGVVVSPNVYNVHVPGRFQIYWASLKIKITNEGKLTRLPQLVKNSPVFKDLKSVQNIMSPTQKAVMGPLWPEAWKVDCTIHDLTVNSFNTYIDYLVDGWNQTTLATLEENRSVANAITDVAKGAFDKAMELLNDVVEWAVSTPASEETAKVKAETERIEAQNRAAQAARDVVTRRIEELMVMLRQLDEQSSAAANRNATQ